MADLQALKSSILADGVVDAEEVSRLEKIIYEDGVIDRAEVTLLVGLRNEAKKVCPEFTALFFRALKDHILADGKIDAEEVTLLRDVIFADGTVDADEKRFLEELRRDSKSCCAEFNALYARCME